MSKLNAFIKNLPFASMAVSNDELMELNKKFMVFDDASLTKDERIQRLSVINQFDNPYNMAEYYSQMGQVGQNFYSNFVYGMNHTDKAKRMEDYRAMGNSPEVEMALREICDEFFVEDDNNEFAHLNIKGDYNEEVKLFVEEEFRNFIKIFDFKNKGWNYVWDILLEGEKYWENIVSLKKPELGIVGITQIDSARIDPIYADKTNELIDVYILRKKIGEENNDRKSPMSAWHQNKKQEQVMFLNDKQITYIHSGRWDEKKRYRLPHIDYARKPYKQLSLIEDATIIYMLVRAPERLVFNIATGNMPPAQAEQYVKRQMSSFWARKTVGADGRPENVYDPQSMLENYFFAKPMGGEGSSVTTVGGGNASPDNLEILLYFVKKLYSALHVPIKRLDSDTQFADGMDISREELRFANLIIDMQRKFAVALKSAFITHLKLRGRKLKEPAKHMRLESYKHFEKRKDGFFSSAGDWQAYDDVIEEMNQVIPYFIQQQYTIIEDLKNQREQLINERNEIVNNLILEQKETENADTIVLEAQIEIIATNITQIQSAINDVETYTKSYWDQYELHDADLEVEFNQPTQFYALREQQKLQIKIETFQSVADIDLFSTTYAMKKYLELSDREIAAIREFARKDAALRWELAQIEQSGPHFREIMKQEMAQLQGDIGGMGGDMGGELGGDLGGGSDLGGGGLGGGSDTDLPEFGDAGDTGGEEPSGTEENDNEPESPKED